MSAIIIAFLYTIIGIVISGIICGYDSDDDNTPYDVLIVMIWPIILIMLTCIGIFRISKRLGKYIHLWVITKEN